MNRPDWKLTFRDLPEIPPVKRWREGVNYSNEQSISFKLLQNKHISKEEEREFKTTFDFYRELDEKLKQLDYSTFSISDFENFKNYIDYAFNYVPLISNKLAVFHTYRLVVNEWVSEKNERLTNIKYLKYPTMDVVRKTNKYNRANTPQTNVLYTAENIDTALKEIKPPTNKLVTVGLWRTKVQQDVVSYPLSHSEQAIMVNPGIKKATNAFEEYGKNNSALFVEWATHYFKVLGREYTKPVRHHYEYLISALFSERILEIRNDPNPSFNFDCIIYPSVGNDFGTDNLAIHPDSVDKKFGIFQIIEFEVEEAYYDKQYIRNHPEIITLAKIKNKYYAKKIKPNGDIDW